MSKRSWFKSEAVWTVAAHYAVWALGVLGLLAASIIAWLRANS